MSDRVFLDTNVVVYMFDDAAPAKQARSREIVEAASHSGDASISTQVLMEFHSTITRKLRPPVGAPEACEMLRRLARLPVTAVDAESVLAAAARAARGGISVWDALIVQSALESDCARIWSEDLQDGAVIDGVRVENPFRDV